MASILVVDDDTAFLQLTRRLLSSRGHEVTALADGRAAIEALGSRRFDVLILDVVMQPMDGFEVLTEARRRDSALPVIVLSGHGSVESAMKALKLGAYDYVLKPLRLDEFLAQVDSAAQWRKRDDAEFRVASVTLRLGSLVCHSQAMSAACDLLERIAPASASVVAQGEAGTGKLHACYAVHTNSPRRERPFLVLDCDSRSAQEIERELYAGAGDEPGLVAAAQGGTLCLKHVETMPLSVQGRFVEAVKDRTFPPGMPSPRTPPDIRVTCTLGCSIDAALGGGKLDKDFLSRLAAIVVDMAPLRRRREDILPLVCHVMRLQSKDDQAALTLQPEARRVLEQYGWPGNVRQVEDTVAHILRTRSQERVTVADLPPDIAVASSAAAPADNTFHRKSLMAFLRQRAGAGRRVTPKK